MAATFSLIGTIEPFLHCNLKQGDSIYCEANAMVMMESNLELKGKLQGGPMNHCSSSKSKPSAVKATVCSLRPSMVICKLSRLARSSIL